MKIISNSIVKVEKAKRLFFRFAFFICAQHGQSICPKQNERTKQGNSMKQKRSPLEGKRNSPQTFGAEYK